VPVDRYWRPPAWPVLLAAVGGADASDGAAVRIKKNLKFSIWQRFQGVD
jgi:hypothetical protein